MNFLQRLKDQVNDERKRRGHREQVLVNAADLRELIYHHERLDVRFRAQRLDQAGPEHRLMVLLHDMYHEHGRSEYEILEMVVGILQPLLDQRQKDERAIKYFGS